MTNRLRLILFFFSTGILTASVSNCKTIENYFSYIHVAVGLEQANTAFVVHKHGIVRDLAPDLESTTIRTVSDEKDVARGYYSLSSAPEPLPVIGKKGFFKYLRTSFTLTSPRTFRGVLNNYPDSGITPTDPFHALLFELYPLPGVAAKKSEFIYEEYRASFTLYFPYFSGENWYFALGNSFSQSRYSLDLIDDNVRLANVTKQWTPVHSISLRYGYRLDNLFSESKLMRDTYVFAELMFDNTSTAQPLNIHILRTSGLPGDRLYAQQSYVRIGIRKTISLIGEPVPSSTAPIEKPDSIVEKEEKQESEKNQEPAGKADSAETSEENQEEPQRAEEPESFLDDAL